MKYFVLLLFILFIFGCMQPKYSVEELYKVDLEFSAKSVEVGFNRAFIEFAHPEAVLLKPESMPITGKPAISGIYKNLSAEGIRFTWKPLGGSIAKSGELGYTYGIYTLKTDSTKNEGTYVSIWKKDKHGKWKYILDSGNEGLDN